MKVAVCLSGQLRKWKLGVDNQKWFWSTGNAEVIEVDYFAHTWTYSWDRPGVSKEYTERLVSNQELDEFKSAFELKNLAVDDIKQNEFRENDHWSALFYSFCRSLILKREYELANNFQYDVVVKSRPDVAFSPSLSFNIPKLHNNVIYSTHGGPMPMEFNMFNVNDCVFLGNSYSMDLLTNLYFYRQNGIIPENIENEKNIHPLGPGTLMHEYFRDYGIMPMCSVGFNEVLLKEGCPEDLDLLNKDEFKIMQKYFQDWYAK